MFHCGICQKYLIGVDVVDGRKGKRYQESRLHLICKIARVFRQQSEGQQQSPDSVSVPPDCFLQKTLPFCFQFVCFVLRQSPSMRLRSVSQTHLEHLSLLPCRLDCSACISYFPNVFLWLMYIFVYCSFLKTATFKKKCFKIVQTLQRAIFSNSNNNKNA